MSVFYTVPLNTYGTPMPDPLVNDELEIIGPIGNKPVGVSTSAEFTLKVNSQTLSNVIVSITLHPDIPLDGAGNPVLPLAADGWTNSLLPSAGTKYESVWTRSTLAKGSSTTFKVKFTPSAGAVGISYRVTFRVNADNYAQAGETVETVLIVP